MNIIFDPIPLKQLNFIKRQPSIDSDQSDDSKSEADTISLSDINFNTSSDWNYIINPNPLGANYWRNNKTGQQQNEPPAQFFRSKRGLD